MASITGSSTVAVKGEGPTGLVGLEGLDIGLTSSCSVIETGLGVGGVEGDLVSSVAG